MRESSCVRRDGGRRSLLRMIPLKKVYPATDFPFSLERDLNWPAVTRLSSFARYASLWRWVCKTRTFSLFRRWTVSDYQAAAQLRPKKNFLSKARSSPLVRFLGGLYILLCERKPKLMSGFFQSKWQLFFLAAVYILSLIKIFPLVDDVRVQL